VRAGVLSRVENSRIVEKLKSIYFPDRTRAILLDTAYAVLGSERAACLKGFLAAQTSNVKTEDARALILELSRCGR
jgi:hypothetical protein